MAAARLSPTANLLRKSRLFALPQALAPFENATTSTHAESDTATLPHPIRASIVTPASSLSRGDWGLKRPLPAKSTSQKSSRPVVRVHELDTFEHVTDFESAADHTVTLEKFQELHMPISLPEQVNFGAHIVPRHQSPFEKDVDNTDVHEQGKDSEIKQFRHTGPWLAGLTEAEFGAFIKKVQKDKPELMRKLRERFIEKRTLEKRKEAQDLGKDLNDLSPVSEEEFQTYVRALRADPEQLGPVVFELLDLPAAPMVPGDRVGTTYYHSPPSKMPVVEYATIGPPTTHPSAGLSYARSHASIYNHPVYGPQSTQRPVEARILRPRGKVKGKSGRAVGGIGGIAFEDLSASGFVEHKAPPGMLSFDGTIPGGGKYYVSPIRVSVNTTGRINVVASRPSEGTKAAYGIQDYQKQSAANSTRYTSFDLHRAGLRSVPRLDRARTISPAEGGAEPQQPSEQTVKRSAKVVIERYYPKLTLDFETNKRVCDEIAIIPSKRLRNKIAGYTTHLMKRIQRGPVRGISFKLQEEERERKDQYVPEISALDVSQTESGQLDVDTDTKDLLKSLGFDNLKVNVVAVTQQQPERPRRFRA
ncbi:mitochondrial ribosomal protein subunit-domain-containing protein [Aspergillus oleicola]